MNAPANPLKIGDKVIFSPNAHAIGWSWSSFERLHIEPGDVGIVTQIVGNIIYIDEGRGGFHWGTFRRATWLALLWHRVKH
jgi:hypothetical protein